MKIKNMTLSVVKYSLVLCIGMGLSVSILNAGDWLGNKGMPGRLGKTYINDTGQFDGNRIYNDLENNGMLVSHRISGHSGMEWPQGTGLTINYASGLWIVGKVGSDIRTAVGEYGPEFSPGPWGSAAGDAANQLYIVNKSDFADPLANSDFQNWPANQGAPWVDVDGDGVYTPLPLGTDHPEFIGDQVIWWVMNDGDALEHNIYNTLPLGIEVQMTIWGYNRPDAFGDMMFVKSLIINKGGNDVDSTYIGLWSDPDLGDAGDDFVGCDTLLSLGYCYNDGPDSHYGPDAPAIGYDFFQGPIVESTGDTAFAFGKKIPGYRNLPMSSFVKYINTDPVYQDPNDAVEAYNYMKGFMRDGSPFIDSETGLPSKFVHPYDPNDNTGAGDGVWVDSDDHASGDRRFLMNSGPFTLADGDTQEVVFGILIARGNSALSSVTQLKLVDQLAQLAYDIQFALPESPPTPNVSVTALKDRIVLNWDDGVNEAESYEAIDVIDKLPVPVSFDTTWVTDIEEVITTIGYDTTIVGTDTTITAILDTAYNYIQVVDGIDTTFQGEDTKFYYQGYNVYQLETAAGQGAIKRLATYDLADGITEIFDLVFDPDRGENVNVRVQFGSDSGIKRSIIIDNDALSAGLPLKTNRAYYFAVTTYGYNPYGIPKTLESPMNILEVRPQVPTTWSENDSTADYGSSLPWIHSVGGSDGTIDVRVVDPTVLTGDNYEVFFDIQHYYRDVDGVWKFTNYPDSVGKVLGKTMDCSGSTITASALASPIVGTVDLTFTFDMDCGDNWVDGITLDLPDDLTINSWESVGDCSYESYGQNCVNMDGTIDVTTNTIVWGDDARSEFGAIEGGQVWIVNIAPPASYPFDISYHVYDDGYDGTIVDAVNTTSVTELGYKFKSIQHWNVKNVTTGEMVFEDQTLVSGVSYENVIDGVLVPTHSAYGETSNLIVEGIQVVVNGPSNGIHGIWQISNANGAIPGVDSDVNENILWINFLSAPDYPTEQAQGGWIFVTHGGGTANDLESFYARVFRGTNFSRAIPNDFEMRFTADALANGMGYRRFEDELLIGNVPFELWNLGPNPDDTSDDFRMLPAILNGVGLGAAADDIDAFDFWGDDASSSSDNDPSSDWVYWGNPDDMSPGTVGYDAWIAPGIGNSPVGGWTEVLARTRLMNWNRYLGGGGDALDSVAAEAAMPEVGTILRWITNKPNTTADKFTFNTRRGKGDLVEYSTKLINVWPNPYFAHNPEERNPLRREINFTHLPEEATIRIFNLAGELVRKLDHNGTQFETWDLTNSFNIPVGSGMYIVHVETDAGDKVLKLAVIMPEERLDVY